LRSIQYFLLILPLRPTANRPGPTATNHHQPASRHYGTAVFIETIIQNLKLKFSFTDPHVFFKLFDYSKCFFKRIISG